MIRMKEEYKDRRLTIAAMAAQGILARGFRPDEEKACKDANVSMETAVAKVALGVADKLMHLVETGWREGEVPP